MCLTCLHPNRENNTTCLYLNQYLIFAFLFPIFTMALNPPPSELYNCAQFALNDINKFAKGQGYAVSKFHLKTDKQSPLTVRKIWLRCAKGNSFKRTAWKRLTDSHITVLFCYLRNWAMYELIYCSTSLIKEAASLQCGNQAMYKLIFRILCS